MRPRCAWISPVGVCEECGFDWDADGAAVVREIDGFGGAYRDLFRSAFEPADARIRVRPSAQVWSALEYIAHMRDVASFYLDRIRHVVSAERPRMHAVGFSALADERRYNDDDVDEVLAALDAHTSETARLLAALSAEQWQRIGIGSDGDERSVLILARRLAHDGHHHLVDLDRVIRAVAGAG